MSTKLTVAIPCMNQLADFAGVSALLVQNTSEDVEYMVIDNGSTDDIVGFFRKTLRPKRLNYIRNEENIGLIKTYQQIYENCETPYLAIIHNDVFIYEKDWDKRVVSVFEKMSKVGLMGFFGAQGCGPHGERIQNVPTAAYAAGASNMLEWNKHGLLLNSEYMPASIMDGFALMFRMEMLKKNNGMDMNYQYHHLYDRELGLVSLALGYDNIVLNVYCHHISGLTANRSEFQTWLNKKLGIAERGDKFIHDKNTEYFFEKWKDYLPLYVMNDFSLFGGEMGNIIFKGDVIRRK